MKRKYIIGVIIIIIVASMLVLGACTKKGSSSTAQKTVLKVFHYMDNADDVATKNFNALIADFSAKNPDIELQFDYLTNEPYHNKLQTLAVANQLPDLVFLWPDKRTGQVTGAGKIKDLSSRLNPHKSEFFPSAMTAQGPNGEMWELPEQVTATHVMFVNTKLLNDLGLTFPNTYAELLAQGDKIRKAGLIPIAMDNKDGWEMQSCFLSALVERNGGRNWLEAAIKGNASFSDPEFVNALNVIKELSDKKMFSPGINSAEYGRALTDFITGKAVYLIDGGWRVSNIVGEMDPAALENVEIKVFPTLANEKGQANSTAVVAGTGFGMNATIDPSKEEAAWKWIWYFAGPEGGKIKQQQGWLPAYKMDMPSDAKSLTKKMAAFLAVTPGGYVLDSVLDGEGMGVLQPAVQEMMLGKLTAKQVADKYETWVKANESGRKK